jgi:hypothetical protein
MQSPDGSFPLWTGTRAWRPCGPLFSTAYIMMGAGSWLPAEIIAKAVSYLRAERRPDGLWEYDKALRLAPDSDSTSCALAALARQGERSDIAGGESLLRAFWREEAGPFRTWNVQPLSGPERDDAVVNGNILFSLRLLGSPPTPAELAAARVLFRRSAGSRYYCYPATIAHAAARAGLEPDVLAPAAAALPSAAHLLGIVQWLCAAQEFEPEALDIVLKAQRDDGAWPIWPWVTGLGTPRPFWGSPAVTTALAIEALDHMVKL